MAEESRRTVLAAMGANVAIAVGKLVAGLVTGSAAMLAESGHSMADTTNQLFLLIGLNLSKTRPDERHPHGHGKEAFFWSFLAAIMIFVAGSAFSLYEGTRTLIQEQQAHRGAAELTLAYGVLGMAFVFESISWTVAVRLMRRGARERGWPLIHYLRRSPDLTAKTVFLEDSAALIGLVLAAIGLGASQLSGSEAWDGVASIGIGIVLAVAALLLGAQSRSLLLGEAANDETRAAIRNTLRQFPEVIAVVRLLTMQLGAASVLVNGELEVARGLTTEQIENLLARVDRQLASVVPEITDTFWELHSRPPASDEAPAATR